MVHTKNTPAEQTKATAHQARSLPWSSSGNTVYEQRESGRRFGRAVAQCLKLPTCAADAAFIVKAVNCHDELVAALKETRALAYHLLTSDLDQLGVEADRRAREQLRTADKALTKAEGRAQ